MRLTDDYAVEGASCGDSGSAGSPPPSAAASDSADSNTLERELGKRTAGTDDEADSSDSGGAQQLHSLEPAPLLAYCSPDHAILE